MEYRITVDGVEIIANEDLSEKEAEAYLTWAKRKYIHENIESVKLTFDGDDVSTEVKTVPVGFEKIRRITGYLVGTIDRFNDSKRAEERDRVKHM